jgi:Holliday junction resolvase RusA-like endonuclease
VAPLESSPSQGRLLATLRVLGINPVASKKASTRKAWIAELKKSAFLARNEMDPKSHGPFMLRVEVRLSPQSGNLGSDLDNYIKAVQDALADAHVFGWTSHHPGVMRGDELIDRLEMYRKRVATTEEAGVVAEVWSLR